MSQEDIQQDTPQENANEQFESLEEAIFGDSNEGSGNIESAFTSGDAEESAPQGTPEEIKETVQPSSNDDKRYQYWQSQADKIANENAALKQQLEQQQSMQQQMPNPNVNTPMPEQDYDSFPEAPAKPTRPMSFNREEAYADPSSESARYLDAVEEWRDDMVEYNTIKSQYDNALVQDKIEAMEAQKRQEAQQFEARQAHMRQEQNIREHVQGHYGLSQAETDDFVKTMSDPQSLNIDNLVQLYRLQKGGAAPQGQTAPVQPSESFRQVQNAQQVPSPMGVMPSGNTNQDGRSFEDKVMDSLIGNYESKNPWK
tara:strand:+ start:2771 stop:3709 length:939 start_codon:yes stop_codon:yes gene_type:complete